MGSIGIMGGTFNPVHMGHVAIAKAAYEQYCLDEVWFMPNHVPAYKSEDRIVSGEDRFEMVRLAIEDIPYCKASDFELRRSGNTYTIDTLKLLKREYPQHNFYFIMGADSLFCFEQWRNYEEIPQYAMLLVAPRNDKSQADVLQRITQWNHYLQKTCFALIKCLDVPCSSSEIRKQLHIRQKSNMLQDNDMDNLFLPESVFEYIKKHKLYM